MFPVTAYSFLALVSVDELVQVFKQTQKTLLLPMNGILAKVLDSMKDTVHSQQVR